MLEWNSTRNNRWAMIGLHILKTIYLLKELHVKQLKGYSFQYTMIKMILYTCRYLSLGERGTQRDKISFFGCVKLNSNSFTNIFWPKYNLDFPCIMFTKINPNKVKLKEFWYFFSRQFFSHSCPTCGVQWDRLNRFSNFHMYTKMLISKFSMKKVIWHFSVFLSLFLLLKRKL